MMIRSIRVLAVGITLLFASTATADVVAYWNFNTFDADNDSTIAADQGSGTISLSSFAGGVKDFFGSTTNALNGDPRGTSLSLQGGTETGGDTYAGNGTFIELSFSMAGMQDLDVSYWTRRTGTGFNANQWSYSADGTNFTDFGPVIDPNATSSGDLSPPLSLSTLDNIDTAFLRYTVSGATSINGNNRIDNLVLTATAIPEPSSLAVLGLAGVGVVALRRRRGSATSAE